MKIRGDIHLLLAEENFQNGIMHCRNFSEEQKAEFLEKYSITQQDLIYARTFLDGISFKKQKLDSEQIKFALNNLLQKTAKKSNSSKVNSGRKIKIFAVILRVAAVLTIPLLCSTIYLYQQLRIEKSEIVYTNEQVATYNTFESPLGAKTQIVLSDGTLVWLNSGSSIKCPSKFDQTCRKVELIGEAFFQVVKNPEVPMVVSTSNMKVKVYGTTFNLNSFADNGMIETTLVEGKVTIIPQNSDKEYALKPGFTASYNLNDKSIVVTKVENMDVFAGWKDGRLLFQNERFVDIIRKLERWYNVDIELTDKSLANYELYATFLDENVEEVLSILSNLLPLKMEYPKRVKQLDGTYSKRKIVIKRNLEMKMLVDQP
jgi:ferric-dicitrate binding protein FerR (iron transport regulator)